MAPRILVVDDEPSIVRLVKASLASSGYDFAEAFDGNEALVQVKLHKPDLILLDIMMPHMDGNEVRKRLLSDPATRDIPVIHLSAVGDFEKQHQALAEGVTDYIVKPFTPSDLSQRVADMLDPKKRDQVKKEHDHKSSQLRALSDIMARKRESGK
jgi:CheY-like chemotaxis protein